MESGVYLVTCATNGARYVGSSKRILVRWADHKRALRRDKHTCRYLQHCWNKHGEASFQWEVLEKCGTDVMRVREQHYIDTIKPELNVMRTVDTWTPSEAMKQKVVASTRARAERRTHCPNGHEYTPENTYRSKPGDKRCRACANDRSRLVFASETPEQREARRVRMRAYYAANRSELRERQNAYSARTREHKRAYDVAYRPIKNARRRAANQVTANG